MSEVGADPPPVLNIYLKPDGPIGISELTNILGSLARQYQQFAVEEKIAAKLANARLLVSNVAPGSIDINVLPDFESIAAAGALIPILHDRVEMLAKFAKRIKRVLGFFLDDEPEKSGAVSVADCDDAVNIANPIALHGGSQTFTVINGPVKHLILATDVQKARKIVERATGHKARLTATTGDNKDHVALVWHALARDAARTTGKKSPDKGIIEEIDPKPHPVFFADSLSFVKREMIDDQENPYQKVFFVDVEISRVPGGGVGNYRITGYHGEEDYEPPSSGGTLLPSA